MLSKDELRKQYDKYGKDRALPSDGFADPAEFFGTIFGGEAFVDLIGEISLMKDLTKTMEISTQEGEEEEEEEFPGEKAAKEASMKEQAQTGAAAGASTTVPPPPSAADFKSNDEKKAFFTEPNPASNVAGSTFSSAPTVAEPNPASSDSGTSTPRRQGIPVRPALMDKSQEDIAAAEAGMTDAEKKLREKKDKKGGLSAAQRAELAAYEQERTRIRKERVDTLAKKLVDRISIWTETDKGPDVTRAFQEKTRLEVENLKMESFGLDILHAIGTTYMQKATALLKSQKFMGIGGFFSRLKDKGTLAKDTWSTISSAIDAQATMEEMARMEERGGEDWNDEKKAEYERRVTGKILTAAWRGSKFEIQSVLRDVCDQVLNDKHVPLAKRLERAQALVLAGEIFQKVNYILPRSSTNLSCNTATKLTFPRLNVIPRKKAIIWPLNSS